MALGEAIVGQRAFGISYEGLIDHDAGARCGRGAKGACSSRLSVLLPASGAHFLAPGGELAGRRRQHRTVPQGILVHVLPRGLNGIRQFGLGCQRRA